MASNKKPSLVDSLKSLPPSRQCKNPMANLTEEELETWAELKRAIRAGSLNHLSMNEIHRQVCAHFGVKIPRSTFRDHMIREGISKPDPDNKTL
jgi:hypothetical protein